MGKRTFRVVLIKPSHYDDDGYVIQWRLSTIPSNSLASVYGLLAACREEQVLGPDVAIEIEACDECNTVVDVRAAARRIKAAGSGFVGLVGVQSNQFPRALDLARAFRAEGVAVVIGGFHVSGCISMLPELPPDLKEAAGARRHPVRGRGRGADGRSRPRHRRRPGEAALQLPPRHAQHGGGRDPRAAERGGGADRRPSRVLRRRPRLPVPVQLLHHHQCPGPQVALPHRRRRRSDRARQPRPGHQPLFRHRRQFRPQPQLGGDPRPADRSAGRTRASRSS